MSRVPSGRRERLVLVGNGMAGARTVEEILARGGGERYQITVFGDEPHGNYNRILLSGVMNGTYTLRDVLLHPPTWYAENGVELHAGERVVAIDRERRTVRSDSGRDVAYDRLLLATGSRAFVPPVEGLYAPVASASEEGAGRAGRSGSVGVWECGEPAAEGRARAPGRSLLDAPLSTLPKPGVFVFRTLDDCRRIGAFARGCRRAAVIGGGLLGLEAAYGLKDLDLEVHVIQNSDRLMDRQLDGPAGEILAAQVRDMGVRVHLGRTTTAILGEDAVTGLAFEDGMTLACEMVILACGIQPNVELARECGLPVGRAVLVDDRMRSVEDPAVYAVGECAEHRGQVYGIVAPLWEQARVLAEHLTGSDEAEYGGSPVATKLKVMGVELTSMGAPEAEAEDEVVQFIEAKRGVYKKLVIRDGRLAGAILLGDGERAPYLLQLFDRGGPLPEERAALLFDLGGRPETLSLHEMPDDTAVCHCNGVCKGDIRECVEGGAAGLHAVMQATRAGTGCGSCRTLVKALVDRTVRTTAAAAPGSLATAVSGVAR
jgi:nitrite reductase (NADH) large subunit